MFSRRRACSKVSGLSFDPEAGQPGDELSPDAGWNTMVSQYLLHRQGWTIQLLLTLHCALAVCWLAAHWQEFARIVTNAPNF
jgi:hypothetical protein